MSSNPKVIAAGHLCLDIIPDLSPLKTGGEEDRFIIPGRLLRIGAASVALGGAVPNTGIALARLGMETTLMGKVGDDILGKTIFNILESLATPGLDFRNGMIQTPAVSSSYTLVVSPPQTDRCFLHCSGANDAFVPEDLEPSRFEGVRLLHFGYPTLMRGIYSAPEAFAEKLAQIREKGTLISLDVTMPDPLGPEGSVDWRNWFSKVLPFVDIYLPSVEETLFMLDRSLFEEVSRRVQRAVLSPGTALNPAVLLSFEEINGLAEQLLDFGVEAAGIKLGDQGIYLRTSSNLRRITSEMPEDIAAQWADRKILAPCFDVSVVGTTGSGDCTIAGFLTGLLHAWPPKQTLRFAAAVGACNVQKADATSGIPSMEEALNWMKKWNLKENLLHPEEVGAELAG